jgi:hypothetical protein
MGPVTIDERVVVDECDDVAIDDHVTPIRRGTGDRGP